MTAEERRAAIWETLTSSFGPVSASALAKRFGVSRQLIVGDVALLRAGGAKIEATVRGYVAEQEAAEAGCRRTVACRHTAEDMERELCLMVDNGCAVLDVIVEHSVYGQLTGTLGLRSRYDVQQFIRRAHSAHPLSLLTEGIHLHTLDCPDAAAYQRVCVALRAEGFLWEN